MKIFSSATGATAVALACLVSSASAAIITQTQPFAWTPVPFSVNLPFASEPAAGLTGIKITLNTWALADIDIFNGTAINQNYINAFSTIPVSATGPGGVNVFGPLISTSAAGVVPPGFTAIPGVPGNLSNFINVPAIQWPLYTSGGLFNVTAAAANGNFGGTAAPGVFFGGSARVSGDVTIDFIYAAVPEPSTYVAGLSALGMLGMFGLRNRKQA